MGTAEGALTPGGIALTALGTAAVVGFAAAAMWFALTSRRLEGASLFNRLFILVAMASGFFSAVSSAIGFSLVTSQEAADVFRNAVLPPAFGAFVFFLAASIWIGGAELVRQRDWFRGMGKGFASDALFFLERALKLFIVVPALSIVLFVVSTWTTVIGLGGVDAVRYVYRDEISRLQSDCAKLAAWRQRDLLIRDDLRLSVAQAARAADGEAQTGVQTGSAGAGAVAAYLASVSRWYQDIADTVAAIVEAPDPTGVSPRDPALCAAIAADLNTRLASDPYANYDAWSRRFESAFNDYAVAINGWRRDRRIETVIDQQLAAFDRANPKPVLASAAQRAAIERFDADVKKALRSLLSKLRDRKNLPPQPAPSARDLRPERGLDIITEWFSAKAPPEPAADEEAKPKARDQAAAEAERIAPLSTITARDAVLLHADAFSDVWALAIAWDYATYILMLAFLFFPSAERAQGFKDVE